MLTGKYRFFLKSAVPVSSVFAIIEECLTLRMKELDSFETSVISITPKS